METNENFETISTKSTKVENDSPHHNTRCLQPNCYSNCHIECSIPSALDLEALNCCPVFSDGTCTKCHHPTADHCHGPSIWDETIESQVVVDEDAKRKFHTASQDKVKYEIALNRAKVSIQDLDLQIDALKNDIGMRCTSYDVLSLSGSFSGQILKLVQLSELILRAMQVRGAEQIAIEATQDGIKKMKCKQEFAAVAVGNTHPNPPDPVLGITARPFPVSSFAVDDGPVNGTD
jgi:hypothetical protein